MVDKIKSCLDRYKEVKYFLSTSSKYHGEESTVSEVNTLDDYDTAGYQGYNNKNRPSNEIAKWAQDTGSLAKYSIYSHLTEIPLKLFSYFYNSGYGDSESFIGKGAFALERFADCLGGMFRNKIYSHKDSNQNLDDNLGADKFAKEKFGDNTTYFISLSNHYFQTVGRFLVPLVGLVSPTLANDFDYFVGGTLDAVRWKRASSNNATYPGFLDDVINSAFSKSNRSLKDVIKYSLFGFSDNYQMTKDSWKKLKLLDSNDIRFKREFYKGMDHITSGFLALSQWPNMIGDLLRPFARRFELTGTPRNLIRTLSVIDRPFMWFNYLFRFYFPERLEENNQNTKYSWLLPTAIVGDAFNFTSTLFEERIKDGPTWLQHTIKVVEILKSALFKIFFSGRRDRIGTQTLKQN